MNKLTSATAMANESTPSPLSPAGYRVLGLLEKRCAYQVHGAWRFRGLHSCVKELTFLPCSRMVWLNASKQIGISR
jgi:hypothetical protein